MDEVVAAGAHEVKTPTRERVLRAARAQFAAHGYAGTSLAVIATSAALRKPSLFAHFASKDELYAAVIEGCAEELHAKIAAAAARSGSVEELARALSDALAGDATEVQMLVRELFDKRAPDAHIADALDEALGALVKFSPVEPHAALSALGVYVLWATCADRPAAVLRHLLAVLAPVRRVDPANNSQADARQI